MDTTGGLVGQTIGKYRIVEHLGRGGMAEVYKAYQPNLDRYVALKLMHAFLAGDQDFISRFEREAKNVAALRHSNIVQVYDFDVENGTPFMVMEFIEGGTLKSYLEDLTRENKPLTVSDAIRIIREVGNALTYAHQRNMIHRDVKPANVLMETGGRVILTDFGIAKILTGPSYTVTGATIGTPAYMSPEQGLGRPGDHRSDLYALGVMLYQLTTGQLPFEADTPLAVMLKHVSEPLPMPRSLKPELPEGMERIILKAMAKNPDDRFQSAEEMLAQLGDMDTAMLLPIPPASMAAGSAAHAATVATPQASATQVAKPTTATEATQLHKGAAAAGAAGAGASSPGAAAASAPAGRRPIGLLAIIGVLLLLLVLAGGAFAFSGGFGMFNQPAAATATDEPTPLATGTETTMPTATETLEAGTATPDLLATQFHSIQGTQDALSAALATETPTATPDMTATTLACTYNYVIASQDPPDARTLTVGSRVTKTLTLRNTGVCAFPAGTILAETNLPDNAPPNIMEVPEIAPNQTGDVSFDWPGRPQAGETLRAFELRLPDETLVSEVFTLTLRYTLAATPVPARTNTPVPPPATATPAVSPLSDLYFTNITNCRYVGDGGGDYECTAFLGYAGGGGGPFTVSVSGQPGQQFTANQAITITIRSRRCFIWIQEVRLVDDGSQSAFSRNLSFDPPNHAAIFPGGGCTLP